MPRPIDDATTAHRRRWFTLLVLCLSLMVIGIDNTILNVALPTLAKPTSIGGLGASASELQWIVDSYTLVFAGLLLTAGSLGDRFGRYRALSLGLVIFGSGSLMSAMAPSASVLIATRALMGIGGAFIMPATLSILTNVFTDPRERGKAIGIWAGVSAIGLGFGPLAGGTLLTHFSWGSVFLVNVPIVLAGLVLGYLLIPDSRDPAAPRLDPLGSVLSIAGLGTLLWALIEGPGHGWTSSPILGGFAAAVVILGGFVYWELNCTSPMLDVHFFQNRRFTAASGAITLTFLALFGTIFLLTQYLQSVLGYSTIQAGALLIPQSLVLMVFAPLSPRLVRRFGNKIVVAVGMFITAASLLAIMGFAVDSPTGFIIGDTMLLGLGMAHIMAPATDSIMGSLPREKAGVGSAMNDTTRQVGGAIGVGLLGSIVSSHYGGAVTEALAGSVPAGLIDRARISIGSAVGLANEPGNQGFAPRVIGAAHQSFVDGMHIAAAVAGLVMIIGALGVLLWLPAHAIEPATVPVLADDTVPGGQRPLSLGPIDAIPADIATELA